MSHAVLQARAWESHDKVLSAIASHGLDPVRSLGRLASYRSGTKKGVPYRRELMVIDNAYLPHPADVEVLTALHLLQVVQLLEQCDEPFDELLVAAFAVCGLMAIQPYRDRNGRIAVDFAELTIMVRRNEPSPSCELPEGIDEVLAPIFKPIFELCDGKSVESFTNQREALMRKLGGTTLDTLRNTPNIVAAAEWLQSRCQSAEPT